MPRDRAASLLVGAVLVLLVIASVAPSPHALLWPDTVRDLSASLEFARGRALPLAGPPINLGPPMGPAWIWLQAIVLPLAPTLAATSVYVASVASLKFLLLYALGRILSGRLLGLCFALGAAMPSIAVFHWHVFWHPDWVEPAVCGSLALLALAMRGRSLGLVYASVGALALATQLHVTALFYLPVHLYALSRLGLRGPRLAAHALGVLAVIAAGFAPALVAPPPPGTGNTPEAVARIGAGLAAFGLADLVTVLGSAMVEVPMAIGETYVVPLGLPRAAWIALLVPMALVSAAGIAIELAANRAGHRRLAAILLTSFFGAWACTTAIRPYTPFYMAYFLLPIAALLAGLGLHAMASSRAALARVAGFSTMGITLATFVASALGAWQVGRSGHVESRLPFLGDLRHPADGIATARWVGASERDAMARFACAQHGDIVLHGEWAYAVAGSTGLDFRMHCPGQREPRLMGPSEAGRAWTLLAGTEAARIGRKPERHFRGLAAFPVRAAHHPAAGRAIESDWYHFEVLRDRQPVSRTSLAFETRPGEAVMVFRMKPFTSRWENFRAERDGAPASPSLSTYNSLVFVAPGPAPSRWRIDFDTDAPQWVDVHVF